VDECVAEEKKKGRLLGPRARGFPNFDKEFQKGRLEAFLTRCEKGSEKGKKRQKSRKKLKIRGKKPK
jgi:hypothetical protein